MMNNRDVGSKYEQVAVNYLLNDGYKLVTTNYRIRTGEIDIIARDGEYIAFVEVKFRSSKKCGSAAGAVNVRKQVVIRKVATDFLVRTYGTTEIPCRFDVVAIDGDEITLIKNAF